MALPLIVHLILLLQLPPSTVQQQQDQKASIEGVVVRIGSGEPISGAEMKLLRVAATIDATPEEAKSLGEAIGLPMLPSTATDRNGRFVFKDVDAGSYRISAARNGLRADGIQDLHALTLFLWQFLDADMVDA